MITALDCQVISPPVSLPSLLLSLPPPLSPLRTGLAGLKSDSASVRSLLTALVPLIKKCPFMTSNDVRSAMYGLQGMHSNSKEVNELIAAFAGENNSLFLAISYFFLLFLAFSCFSLLFLAFS